MGRCPICHTESDTLVHANEVEVRGKKYRQEILYCASCGVKFSAFTLEEEPASASEKPEEKPPVEEPPEVTES